MPTIEELTARFQADRFATEAAGIVIREAEPGRALCAMKLRPCHMNANNVPMGGAVFTLADFAYAVASNGFTDKISVTQHVSITFLSPAKGTELLAEARSLKDGRTTCLYEVDVRDELGTYVAHAAVNGFTVK
ncbi:MAG: PaaI family thioesterase [Oscillospiraceae bacterium]|jgi:acyl-CoA thioesterase|nr:PaaI family thioesterase [Oscillospiraceae bacterium]MDE6996280.1 PaaI family thioesterase [Oscillospiraceae bacterium]